MFKLIFRLTQQLLGTGVPRRGYCKDCAHACKFNKDMFCENNQVAVKYVKPNDFCFMFTPYSITKAMEEKAVRSYLERCAKSGVPND